MPSMQESLIESLKKDIETVKNVSDKKVRSKEYSMILARIKSAKKLFLDNESLLHKLEELERKTLSLKS